MRVVVALSAVVLVILAAIWVYRVNYQTQVALDRVEALRAEILEQREAISVLRAEWAYLNRPDRLRVLATPLAETLGLGPLMPEQFADANEIPFPTASHTEVPAAGETP